MPQKRMECFTLLLEHLAWIEHQFLSGIRDSRKAGSLWGMMGGVGRVRKSVHQSWLAKGLGLLCWGFKGVQQEIQSEEASTLQIGSMAFPPVHNSILVTDYLSKTCCIVTTMIHMQLYTYTYTCGNIINNNDERTLFFRKIYLSHFIQNGCERVAKGLRVKGELETEQTATYWPPVPLSLAALLSRSAGLINRGSWWPIALCRVLVLSTESYLQLTDIN